MNNFVREKLKEIITIYGQQTCDDPRECEYRLKSVCSGYNREIDVLLTAMKVGIVTFLRNFNILTLQEKGIFINRLKSIFTRDQAEWAMESWLYALNIQSLPLSYPKNNDQKFSFETIDTNGKIISKIAYQLIEDLGGVKIEMVSIPSGSFIMGSQNRQHESPQRIVTVKTFHMGKYPVTQEQWRYVASLPEVNKSLISNPSYFNGDYRPVESISWDDAVEFCARLSVKTGKKYRLPSEAGWEYACRAETDTQFYFGDTINSALANYSKNNNGTLPITYFCRANAFGLYDMHGQIWEWCADPWHENYNGTPPNDGSVWNGTSPYHVVRGGAWSSPMEYLRSTYRSGSDSFNNMIGFRVVFGG